MNTTLLNMINGIAVAAKAKTPPDMNAISACEDMLQIAEYKFGTTYDAATTNSTLILLFPNYATGPVSGSFDSQTASGVTNVRTIGG